MWYRKHSKLSSTFLCWTSYHYSGDLIPMGKSGTGNGSRMTKVLKQSVMKGMVRKLILKMKTFSLHFNATIKLQYDQYKNLTREVPLHTAVFWMDYVENFKCKAHDSPQGIHWNTIHPVVCNYVCTGCEQEPALIYLMTWPMTIIVFSILQVSLFVSFRRNATTICK